MEVIQSPKIRTFTTNRLATSPHFAQILQKYNEEWKKTNGKVNEKKFHTEVIVPLIPEYGLQNFYQFLRRFKDAAGVVILEKINQTVDNPMLKMQTANIGAEVEELQKSMLSVQQAETAGIALALNIAHDKLKSIYENPSLMTAKDAIDMLFKSMKARDSRIHAIGKVREDNREEEKLERAFDMAAYGE